MTLAAAGRSYFIDVGDCGNLIFKAEGHFPVFRVDKSLGQRL